MFLQDSAGRRVTLGRELARGGEAAVYLVDGRSELVAKVYTTPRPGYDGKLAWMRDHPPVDRRRSHGHASIAWPSDLLRDRAGTVAGYLMPFVKDAVPLLEVFNPRRRARTLPGFDWRYLHRAARNLAAALAALHDRGYVVGDLNESNILITPAALVTLIDTDSFQVQEPRPTQIVVYPCPVGRWEYTPPELQGQAFRGVLRQPQHDCFGLAVLIFQLLMDGSHPFRSQWLGSGDPPALEEKIVQGWFPYAEPAPGPVAPPANAPSLNILHPDVVQLMRRCFVEGHRNPRHRPDPHDWERILEEAEQAIVQCQNGHLFSSHARACPRCGARASRGGRRRPAPAAPVKGTGTQSATLAATTQTKPAVRRRVSLRGAPSRVAVAVARRVREGVREELARLRPLRLSWRARIGALLILGALGSALVPTARGVGGRFFGIAGGEPAPNLVRILAHEPTGVRGIAFSPDGHTVAFGVADGTIRLLRLSDETVPQTVAAHRGQVTSVAFAPDGNVLASGSWDATVRLRRPEGGALLQTLAGHTAPVWSVALSPDGSLLASASADRTLRLWRVADGAALWSQEMGSSLYAVTFSPDGMTLATGGADGAVSLWGGDGSLAWRRVGHGGPVWSVAFAPNGSLLASGSTDRTVRVWDVVIGDLVRKMGGHGDWVTSVAFAPDSALVASGSRDATVRVWGASDGVLQGAFDGHAGPVESVAFAPGWDGLVSASSDGTVRLWSLP